MIAFATTELAGSSYSYICFSMETGKREQKNITVSSTTQRNTNEGVIEQHHNVSDLLGRVFQHGSIQIMETKSPRVGGRGRESNSITFCT